MCFNFRKEFEFLISEFEMSDFNFHPGSMGGNAFPPIDPSGAGRPRVITTKIYKMKSLKQIFKK